MDELIGWGTFLLAVGLAVAKVAERIGWLTGRGSSPGVPPQFDAQVSELSATFREHTARGDERHKKIEAFMLRMESPPFVERLQHEILRLEESLRREFATDRLALARLESDVRKLQGLNGRS